MSEIVEAGSDTEEAEAFANGAKIVIRTDLLPPPPPEPEDYEDFSLYDETDPSGVMSVIANEASFSNLTRATSTYLKKDFGAAHFGDYSIDFDYRVSACSSGSLNFNGSFIVLSNSIGDWQAIKNAGGAQHGVFGGNNGASRFLCLSEIAAGTGYSSGLSMFAPALNTTYHCRLKRDMSVGAYGSITLEVYSDTAHTQLLNSQTLALHSSQSFRYLYIIQSVNSGHSTVSMSGSISNVLVTNAAN
jgi:hypothetical protein